MDKDVLDNLYHPYPAVWFFSAYAGGIAFGWFLITRLSLPQLQIVFVFSFIIFLLIYLFYRRYLLVAALFVLFFAGTLNIRFQLAQFPPNHLVHYNSKKISALYGRIDEALYRKDGKHRYRFDCDSVVIGGTVRKATGTVLLYQGKARKKFEPGDILKINQAPGRPALPSNPGAFNYRHYLQLNGIFHTLYPADDETIELLGKAKSSWSLSTILEPLRNSIRRKIDRFIPEPAASVVKALLLGERQDVDRSLLEKFQKTGIIHVLAISGLHVGFLLLIFMLLFTLLRLPYGMKIFLSLGMLFLFVALVDFKTPVVRAAVMIALYYLAQFLERRTRTLNILAGAGLLLLFFDPAQLLQPGFQFSFAAVFGILYGYPRLRRMIPSPRFYGRLGRFIRKYGYDAALVSTAAVMGTVPLTWHYYGTLQTGALLINIVIIPAIGLLLTVSFLFIPLSFLNTWFAEGLGGLIHYIFKGIETAVTLYAKLPFVQVYLPHPSPLMLMVFILLLFAILNLKSTGSHSNAEKVSIFSAKRFGRIVLLFFILYLLIIIPRHNGNTLQYTQLDVRQGDCALVRFPGGVNILVDGGQSFPFDAAKRFVLPTLRYYGVKRLRYLVGTHNHNDHIGGFPTILREMQVDTLVLSPKAGKSRLYRYLLKTAQDLKIPVLFGNRGRQLYVGDKARAYILHPTDACAKGGFSGREVNNSSLVLKIVYGRSAFLLTGDLEMSAEKALFSYGNFLNARVLKVGHHGSVTSTSQAFLNLIRPRYALISVGKGNKYRHPGKATLGRLRKNSVAALRTDHFGALVFESDGQNLRMVNWRTW